MKRYGEMGSPCHKPHRQLIQGLGQPLTSTADLEDYKVLVIHFLQISLNPLACSTTSSASQLTVSKAFAKSNFITKVGILRL